MRLYVDLHIHTALSPCSDDDMTPYNITAMAKLKGLDAIAITDHNSCLNVAACEQFGKHNNLIIIPGMELHTREDVHVICLFDCIQRAQEFQSLVWEKQAYIKNHSEIFGRQLVFDKDDNISYELEKLLITSTDLSFDEAFRIVEELGGAFIPAHIDKSSNSVISNLGFIPPDTKPVTLEYRSKEELEKLIRQGIITKDYNFIKSSDAHYLHEILEKVTYIDVKCNNTRAIIQSLTQGQNDKMQ